LVASGDKNADDTDVFASLVPSMILVITITVTGKIYGGDIAPSVINKQNHRTDERYEEGFSKMMYKFTFFNSFTPYFIMAFWELNVAKLAGGVLSFMIYKQLALNVMEFLKAESNTKLRINKVKREFEIKIEKESCPYEKRKLELLKRIESEITSDKVKPMHVNLYKETVIQFGFLAMFASSMPLTPLLAILTNAIEMVIRIKSMCLYSRRMKA